MLRRKTPLSCLEGRHVPKVARAKADALPGDPDVPQARCSRCGHLLVKSPITRKWRAIGLMGVATEDKRAQAPRMARGESRCND